MKIPKDVLQVLTDEEIAILTKLYYTDFREAYLKRLKKKYAQLLIILED